MDKLLIVDDDPFIVEELQEFLTDAGYTCIGCTDPNEAIRIFNEDENISIIISDFRMPDITGVELIQMLGKSKRKERALGSIIFAADSEINDVIAALRADVHDYYTKPLDLELLLKGIQRLEKKIIEKRQELSKELITERISTITNMLQELQIGVGQLYKEKFPHPSLEISSRPSEELDLSSLTPRQTEVARLIGQGMTNYQIACELNISENTVKLYASQVLKATGMPSRTRLAIALNSHFSFLAKATDE